MKISVTVDGIGSSARAARVTRLRDRVVRDLQSASRQRDGALQNDARDALDGAGQHPLKSVR
jgi:hypothetical protein